MRVKKQLIMWRMLFTASVVFSKVQHDPGDPLPSFGDPVQNITVIKGRDITFTCIVKNLGLYKVGWVKADTKAIQAIHHQVVTHNPRVSVTYRDKTTWNLHIRDVQEDDDGIYMCQVNTDPMIAEMAYLEVVVPPQIVDEESSGETEAEEGASVTLVCKARGHPTPHVVWQREGGHKIVLRENAAKKVSKVEGEVLRMTKLKRQDMGPYLCIAKNGIPPSVSKRIMLIVHFKPVMEVPLHMFGSPLGEDITIACKVESSPKAVNTWKKFPGDHMIITSGKYNVTEETKGYYVTIMRLTIKNFTKEDATNYACSSSNSLGFTESTIQVYEIPTPKVLKESNAMDNFQTGRQIPKNPIPMHPENPSNSYPTKEDRGSGREKEKDLRKHSLSDDKSKSGVMDAVGGAGGGGSFTFFWSGCEEVPKSKCVTLLLILSLCPLLYSL